MAWNKYDFLEYLQETPNLLNNCLNVYCVLINLMRFLLKY